MDTEDRWIQKQKRQQEDRIRAMFSRLDAAAQPVFAPYRDKNYFGDTSFSLLYAWQGTFQYAYRLFGEYPVVLEKSMDGSLTCILFGEKNTRMEPVVAELDEIFQRAGLPLLFGYVAEEELPFYAAAFDKIGKQMIFTAKEEDRDYIYDTESFLCLDGKDNRRKRGDLNHLEREYPSLSVVFYDGKKEAIKRDCQRIFSDWCRAHSCQNCVYGCEKQACLRFFDIFDPKIHQIAVAYNGDEPLSFAMSGRIRPDTVCYCFQKNRQRIRGLTYWLNREMLLFDPDTDYINLGEDMGLFGLREDKSSLHPCEWKKKYAVCAVQKQHIKHMAGRMCL